MTLCVHTGAKCVSKSATTQGNISEGLSLTLILEILHREIQLKSLQKTKFLKTSIKLTVVSQEIQMNDSVFKTSGVEATRMIRSD